jgi:hypothetical protein
MNKEDIHTCHAECQRPACVAVRKKAIMTDKQPEALRLADGLEKEIVRTVHLDVLHQDALNELRRLHDVNAELIGELKDIRDNYDCDEDAHRYGTRCRSCVARAAIAKATGEQQ